MTINRGTGSSLSEIPLPSQGPNNFIDSSFEYGRTSVTPEIERVIATARLTLASRSRPGAGMIWIVISREISDCHSPAAFVTRTAAPVVNDTKNVMIATTATRARPEIELRGTSAVSNRGMGSLGSRNRLARSMRASLIAGINHKYATGRRVARDVWHRTDPSARYHASR